jgi:hypothetical protein
MSTSIVSDSVTDVLIVGGGSAGAVLAARLSQDPARTVRLLEARHAHDLASQPADLLNPAHVPGEPEHDWGFTMRGNERNPEIVAPRGRCSAAVRPSTPPSRSASLRRAFGAGTNTASRAGQRAASTPCSRR